MDVTSYLLGKQSGGSKIDNQNKDVTITENGSTTVSADEGYTGLGTVGIQTNVQPNLESKSVTITENTTTNVTADTGYDGLSSVSVTTNVAGSGISDYIDSSFSAGDASNTWTKAIKKLPPISINGTNWSYAFAGYKGAEIPTISSSGANVTSLYNMFQNCSNVTSIDLSYLSFSNLQDIGSLFQQCSNLTSFILGNNFDTSNVTNMSSMFNSCTSLVSLDVSNFDTSNVTDMSYMFSSNKFVTLNISNFDFSKVVNINRFLRFVYDLENLIFGTNLGKGYLTTASANKSEYTLDLSSCTKLTHDSLMSVINNLYDIATAGVQPQKLILGATNLDKLSQAEIDIATAKGWTVS